MATATFVLASLVWSLLASASICRQAYRLAPYSGSLAMLAAMRCGSKYIQKGGTKSLVHCKANWLITVSKLAAESGAKMDSSDTAEAQVLSVEQSQQDDRQKVLNLPSAPLLRLDVFLPNMSG